MGRPARPRRVRRLLAIAALLIALVFAGRLLLSPGGSYEVTAVFDNAGQLVVGNQVLVGSIPVGSVEDIRLDNRWQAEVVISVNGSFSPLHQGTSLVTGVPGIASIAGRFITMQPGPNSAPEIPDGGRIPVTQTQSPVEVDQLLSALDPRTVRGLQRLVQGGASSVNGESGKINQALLALDPALSQASATLHQAVSDRVALRRLVANGGGIVHTLAGRSRDIAAGTAAASQASGAIASQRDALARSIGLAPPALRETNTALVNVRAALNDLRPVIPEARPVARDLSRLLPQLRPLSQRLRAVTPPLDKLIRGPALRLLEELPNASRQGMPVLGDLTPALRKLQPALGQIRPYAPELTSGLVGGIGGNVAGYYDANGQYARIAFVGGPFSISGLTPTPQSLGARSGRVDRCPGGAIYPAADHSNPWTEGGKVDCNPAWAGSGP